MSVNEIAIVKAENKTINVLSLFDGMSCGRIALGRADIEVNNYYSAEIDKYAIQVADKNYPQDTDKRLGDVTKWRDWNINWSSIDLVTGGFPCQAWSVAGKQLGDRDERGMLFWTMLDIMKNVLYHNPKAKFLMENVKMKKEFEEYITLHTENALGTVYKHLINSNTLVPQNRQRYYWTNIEDIMQPCDTNKKRKLITLDEFGNKRANIPAIGQAKRIYSQDGMMPALNTGWTPQVFDNGVRRLTVNECEMLQTIPLNYTEGISNSQRYKMLGNGWTVDVIAHILRFM